MRPKRTAVKKTKKKGASPAVDPVGAALDRLFAGPADEVEPSELTPELVAERARLILFWSEHPWNWLTGQDTTGKPIIWTKDESADDPLRPFPTDKEYLNWYIDLLFYGKEFPLIFVDKCRQMMLTWATLLYVDWECRFRKGRRWLLSKSTESEAKELLRDKLKWVQIRLPEWVQDAIPAEFKPQERANYPLSHSYILAVAENVADREARGGTASGVVVDECARQHGFGDIVGAAMPMATRLVAITTAELGNPGAAFCADIKRSASKHGTTIDVRAGEFESRTGTYWHVVTDAVSKWTVVEIEAEADPCKRTIAWHEDMERKLKARKYRQEIRRDWTISSNDPFYPEFAGNPLLYSIGDVDGLLDGPIIRGWDFGYRFPACVWLQVNERRNRAVVLREFMPQDIDAESFAEVVLWLSGQVEETALGREAFMWSQRIRADADFPPVPFFDSRPSRPLQFVDYSGPEALVMRSEVTQESQARSVAQILAKKGIQLSWWGVSLESREIIVRKLLRVQKDGLPGLLFTDWCKILKQGFAGGLTFRKGDTSRRSKDGYFEHLDDALEYALANLFSVEGELPEASVLPLSAPQGRDTFSRGVPIGTENSDELSLRVWK